MFISTDVTFFESQPYYLKPSPPLPLPIMLDDIQSPPMVLRFADPPITYQRKPKLIIPDSRPPPSNKFADPHCLPEEVKTILTCCHESSPS